MKPPTLFEKVYMITLAVLIASIIVFRLIL